MKKSFLTIVCSVVLLASAIAQVPQTFSYQAIARDNQGNLISSQSITVRIGILQNESLIWQEDHSVTTNGLGYFTLMIGDPDAQNMMGSAGSFAEIPWGDGPVNMQVSVDAGSGFEELGASELQSVPYALYAADGPGGTGPQGEPGPQGPPGPDEQELTREGTELSISNGNTVDLSPISGSGGAWNWNEDTLHTFNHVGIGTSNPNLSTLAVQGLSYNPESPLFEVRREDGFPVFAVYNDGVMVYVDEETKGRKGGFAVGGYSRTTKGLNQEYMMVTPDSVRIYVPEDELVKGRKGGFAVGGYSRTTKGPGQDFLFVNPDSTRVYVPNKENDPDFGEGLQGGFAVSGYTAGKGSTDYMMGLNRGITRFNTSDIDRGFAIGNQGEGWGSSYLELTPTNSFIGTSSGLNNYEVNPDDEWGLSSMNVFIGYQSGMENLYGHHNTFVGFCAGTKNLGDFSDPELGSNNLFLGTQAGFENTTGFNNVYSGYHAGIHNTDGYRNVFIGNNAGAVGVNTRESTMVGADAGREYTGPGEVTFLGRWAGNNNTGTRNTYVGHAAGSNTGGGNENISMGWYTGLWTTGDRNVIIGNEAGRGSDGNTDGNDNVLIGHNSAKNLTSGETNVILGSHAGYNVGPGSGNVFIGYQAGFNETGDEYLYIDNTDTDYPLIFGDFIYDQVAVYGDFYLEGGPYTLSDVNAKTHIKPLQNSLSKVMSLDGISFDLIKGRVNRRTGATETNSSIGFTAQDVEKVFPSLVRETKSGLKAVNYSGLIPVLLEAIKEQQGQVESLERRIAELEGNKLR
jgi:hypothetical protein